MSSLSEPTEPTQSLPVAGRGRGRSAAAVAGVAALVVAVLGGAAYAAYSLLDGGGPRPEDALPTTTVALVSIDLDPHAGQKIEAIKTLRKFPALRKTLGIESQDDLREYIVDKGLSDCTGVDYARDVKPWIGKRAAFAGVDLGGKYPAPAIVLQVEDAAKAKTDFAKLADCAGKGFGYVVGKDYLIASDSTAHAQQILDSAEKKPLADDQTFQRWDGEAGDGVAGFYVAPRAARYLDTVLSEIGPGFAGLRTGNGPLASLHDTLKDFKGAAGSLRFADGGLELDLVGDSAGQKLGEKPIGPVVAALPADTALALGMAFPKDFGGTLLDQVKAQLGEQTVKEFLDEARNRAGLQLPGDVDDLLGNAMTLSVGGDAPSSADAFDDPAKLPAGIALHGDPDKSLAVLTKVEKALGISPADAPVQTRKSGDALLISPSKAYLDQLAEKGSLGDNGVFTRAVPDADHAGMVFFVAIDQKWREAIVDLAGTDLSESRTQQLADNLKPFEAIGLSSTVDGGVARFQLRITTR